MSKLLLFFSSIFLLASNQISYTAQDFFWQEEAKIAEEAKMAGEVEEYSYTTIKLMGINICTTDNSPRGGYTIYDDKEHPGLHPHERLPRISAIIKMYAPDVVCFQECRRAEALMITEQLSDDYNTIMTPLNGTKLANYFVTAYRRETLLPEQNSQYWLTGESGSVQFQGNEWCPWGRLLTGVTFALLEKNGLPDQTQKRIHVFNTHLGLCSKEKKATTKELIACIKKNLGEQFDIAPIALMGDFNTFMDQDGSAQRKLITDEGFVDPLIDLRSIDGHQLSGSFPGYSTDRSYIPKKPELLDGAFVKNAQVVGPAVALTDDIEGLEGPITNEALIANRDKLLSDHLPIMIKIALKNILNKN